MDFGNANPIDGILCVLLDMFELEDFIADECALGNTCQKLIGDDGLIQAFFKFGRVGKSSCRDDLIKALLGKFVVLLK